MLVPSIQINAPCGIEDYSGRYHANKRASGLRAVNGCPAHILRKVSAANAQLLRELPTRFGLPVIVVLDADGKALTTQDTGKLEEGDHHDLKKVLAFLNQWEPVSRVWHP